MLLHVLHNSSTTDGFTFSDAVGSDIEYHLWAYSNGSINLADLKSDSCLPAMLVLFASVKAMLVLFASVKAMLVLFASMKAFIKVMENVFLFHLRSSFRS